MQSHFVEDLSEFFGGLGAFEPGSLANSWTALTFLGRFGKDRFVRFAFVLTFLLSFLSSSPAAMAVSGRQCDQLFKINLSKEAELPEFLKTELLKSTSMNRSVESVKDHERFFRQVRDWRSGFTDDNKFISESVERRLAFLLLARMENYLTLTGNSFVRKTEPFEFGQRTVLLGVSSAEGKIDRLMTTFRGHFPQHRVMFDPMTYLRMGFSAWISGNRMGIGDPTLISEPGSNSAIFLHEFTHIRLNGSKGSVRAIHGSVPTLLSLPRSLYDKFQSHDEADAFGMSFRREIKELESVIKSQNKSVIEQHFNLAQQAARMSVEVLGRNVWTAGMILHNFDRLPITFQRKSETHLIANIQFVAEGSKVESTMPIFFKKDSMSDSRDLLFSKYEAMYNRDARQVDLYIAMDIVLNEMRAALLKTPIDVISLERSRRALYAMYLQREGPPRVAAEWTEFYRRQIGLR